MRKGNCADQPDWAVMCAHHTNKVCMYFQLRALLEMLCTHVAVNGVIQQSIANIGNSSQRHCTYIYISFSKNFDWQKHHFSLNIVLGIQTSSHIVCYRLPIADHYESCSWQGLLSTLKSKNITMSILAWRDKNHNFCPNAPVMRPMFLFLVKNKSLNDIIWWRTKFTILRMGMNNNKWTCNSTICSSSIPLCQSVAITGDRTYCAIMFYWLSSIAWMNKNVLQCSCGCWPLFDAADR